MISFLISISLIVSQFDAPLSKDEILLDFVKVDVPNSFRNVYPSKVVDSWLKNIAEKPVTIVEKDTGAIKVIGKAVCGYLDKQGNTKIRIVTYQDFNNNKYVLRPYCSVKKSSVSDSCNLIVEDADLKELMLVPKLTASKFE